MSEGTRGFLPKSFGSVNENLGRSPILRHKNYEDLSRSIDFDFDRGFCSIRNDFKPNNTRSGSKYLSKDSLLSQEMEEVRNLSRELTSKFGEYQVDICDTNPDQTIFYNDHYMSDIDENEEIKEFCYGYSKPRRKSDEVDRHLETRKSASYSTLPSFNSFKYRTFPCTSPSSMRIAGETFKESTSSFKSSDYYGESPEELQAKVLKTPHRPVVKLAKIRLVIENFLLSVLLWCKVSLFYSKRFCIFAYENQH